VHAPLKVAVARQHGSRHHVCRPKDEDAQTRARGAGATEPRLTAPQEGTPPVHRWCQVCPRAEGTGGGQRLAFAQRGRKSSSPFSEMATDTSGLSSRVPDARGAPAAHHMEALLLQRRHQPTACPSASTPHRRYLRACQCLGLPTLRPASAKALPAGVSLPDIPRTGSARIGEGIKSRFWCWLPNGHPAEGMEGGECLTSSPGYWLTTPEPGARLVFTHGATCTQTRAREEKFTQKESPAPRESMGGSLLQSTAPY